MGRRGKLPTVSVPAFARDTSGGGETILGNGDGNGGTIASPRDLVLLLVEDRVLAEDDLQPVHLLELAQQLAERPLQVV